MTLWTPDESTNESEIRRRPPPRRARLHRKAGRVPRLHLHLLVHCSGAPPPKPICGATSKSAHLRSTRWSSPSNEPVLSDVNPASLEASRSSFLQKKSQSLNGSKSTSQILCDEVPDESRLR